MSGCGVGFERLVWAVVVVRIGAVDVLFVLRNGGGKRSGIAVGFRPLLLCRLWCPAGRLLLLPPRLLEVFVVGVGLELGLLLIAYRLRDELVGTLQIRRRDLLVLA